MPFSAATRRQTASTSSPITPDDAGGVDEGRLGLVVVDQLDAATRRACSRRRRSRPSPAGRWRSSAVQFRARGERSADVPGVGRAADGAVDQVQGVGDGIEHHPRSAEDAGPLAHRPGQAGLVAGHVDGCRPVSWTCVLRPSRISIMVGLVRSASAGRDLVTIIGL